MDEKIFKSYDIRGLYPSQVNDEAAFEIGKAFAKYIGSQVVVGRDMRASSDGLFDSFARGVNSMGVDVIEIGMCTTPLLNFAVAHKGFKGGAMITASHNPSEYNGIKLIGEKAVQMNKDRGIGEMKELVLSGNLRESKEKGKQKKLDIINEYIDFITEKIGVVKPMKVVVDCGNGVAALTAKPVFEKLGIRTVEMYFEPDGSFPNHLANPAEEENLKDAERKVVEEGADLGVVFDGDGDRAFFIDENGKTHNVGFLLAAIADHELKNHKGEKVYYDLRFSKKVIDTIKNAGGVPVRTRVGNPFFKQQLILGGGLMAAEYSGHFMYSEHYGLDDGLFSALKLIYWLSKTDKTFSAFVEPYERGSYVTGEINFEVEDQERVISDLEKKYSDGEIDRLDGVTIEYPDWWFNLRSSNTEPVVRLNIEAKDEKLMKERLEEVIKIIEG